MTTSNDDSTTTGQPTAQTPLTVDDVKNIIAQAQAGGDDPVTVALQIFDRLGNNIVVAGDVLRQALDNSNIPVSGPLATLVTGIETVAKTGNQVTVTNTGQTQTQISGTPIRFKPAVTFNVGTDGGFPTLSGIQGASAHKVFWFDIKEIQLKQDQGRKILHVETSGGTREFPLPSAA